MWQNMQGREWNYFKHIGLGGLTDLSLTAWAYGCPRLFASRKKIIKGKVLFRNLKRDLARKTRSHDICESSRMSCDPLKCSGKGAYYVRKIPTGQSVSVRKVPHPPSLVAMHVVWFCHPSHIGTLVIDFL